MSGNDQKELVETGVGDENGQFIEGHPALPGGGRPAGSMDFMTVLRKKAKEKDFDLEQAIWGVGMSLLRAAINGDTKAAAQFLDRVVGVVDKGPMVAIDQRVMDPALVDAFNPRGLRGPPVSEASDLQGHEELRGCARAMA